MTSTSLKIGTAQGCSVQVTEYLNAINFRRYLPEWTRLLSLVKPAIQVPREKQVKRKKGETGRTETWEDKTSVGSEMRSHRMPAGSVSNSPLLLSQLTLGRHVLGDRANKHTHIIQVCTFSAVALKFRTSHSSTVFCVNWTNYIVPPPQPPRPHKHTHTHKQVINWFHRSPELIYNTSCHTFLI